MSRETEKYPGEHDEKILGATMRNQEHFKQCQVFISPTKLDHQTIGQLAELLFGLQKSGDSTPRYSRLFLRPSPWSNIISDGIDSDVSFGDLEIQKWDQLSICWSRSVNGPLRSFVWKLSPFVSLALNIAPNVQICPNHTPQISSNIRTFYFLMQLK